MSRRLVVMQGGGPTSVINATLAGIAEQAAGHFEQLLGFRNSFEQQQGKAPLNLTSLLSSNGISAQLDLLADTPGAILGSSRRKVEETDLRATLSVIQRYGVTDLIGIGGNGTMTVLALLARFAESELYPLNIIGAPKTVDNDLAGVYAAPGYGSAARYVALAVRDYDCDFRSMSTFDDVTVLETMGRNSGWLAAAATLLKQTPAEAPHIVLLPEQPFDEAMFLDYVAECHSRYGRVFVVTNEMLSDVDGAIVGEEVQRGPRDSLGRAMYSLSSGTGNYLANLIWTRLGLQARCLRPGTLGRAMSFCQSETDRQLALDAGRAAVAALVAGEAQQHMLRIDEDLGFSLQRLEQGAGEKPLPDSFICKESPFLIDCSFKNYALPLIGKVTPLFDAGIFSTDR